MKPKKDLHALYMIEFAERLKRFQSYLPKSKPQQSSQR